jgi:hypothetical protein
MFIIKQRYNNHLGQFITISTSPVLSEVHVAQSLISVHIQTIQWSKWKTTDNTMVKMKNDRQYNGQNEKRQHFDHCIVCRFSFWPLYCLLFSILTIVLSVIFHFDHCIVCRFPFWPLYCLSFFILTIVLRQTIQWSKWNTTDNTMVKMKNDRQYNGQNEKRQTNGQNEARQTIQWSKWKRANTHTMICTEIKDWATWTSLLILFFF